MARWRYAYVDTKCIQNIHVVLNTEPWIISNQINQISETRPATESELAVHTNSIPNRNVYPFDLSRCVSVCSFVDFCYDFCVWVFENEMQFLFALFLQNTNFCQWTVVNWWLLFQSPIEHVCKFQSVMSVLLISSKLSLCSLFWIFSNDI